MIPIFNKRIKEASGVTLRVANKLYLQLNRKLNSDFEVDTKNLFESDVQHVDFKENVKTAKEINEWVCESAIEVIQNCMSIHTFNQVVNYFQVKSKTNNRIDNLVTPNDLAADTGTVLVNAIYFKVKTVNT